MRVLICTAASHLVGFGHLRRCLSLAGALRTLGADAVFALDGDDESMALARAEGFQIFTVNDRVEEVQTLSADLAAEVVIVDTYDFGDSELSALVTGEWMLCVIDDSTREHVPADMIINAVPGVRERDYIGRTSARLLLGPA